MNIHSVSPVDFRPSGTVDVSWGGGSCRVFHFSPTWNYKSPIPEFLQLPHVSVMHAIRLAEQYRLADTKHKLFESISIDVFRSLAADEDYRQMGAELKAELLEKWGTFL